MPPWQPARPTPAPTARETFCTYLWSMAPIVQQATMRSSFSSASASSRTESVSEMVQV